jgi:hypothetical protein
MFCNCYCCNLDLLASKGLRESSDLYSLVQGWGHYCQ